MFSKLVLCCVSLLETSSLSFIYKQDLGEMAQQLVAFAVLTEDLSFVPSSRWGSSQQPITPSRMKLAPFSRHALPCE